MSDKLFYSIEEEKETDKNEKTDMVFSKLEEIEKREELILLDQKNYKEGLSAFAKELPKWSIEPLQIIVKRGR